MTKFAHVGPGAAGYAIINDEGELETFGDLGPWEPPAERNDSPVIGMQSTDSGRGLWVFHEDGNVDHYGDAHPLDRLASSTGQQTQAEDAAQARIRELEAELAARGAAPAPSGSPAVTASGIAPPPVTAGTDARQARIARLEAELAAAQSEGDGEPAGVGGEADAGHPPDDQADEHQADEPDAADEPPPPTGHFTSTTASSGPLSAS